MSKIEREETKLIEQGCKLVGNRWEMAYPWHTDPKTLPDNRSWKKLVKKLEAGEEAGSDRKTPDRESRKCKGLSRYDIYMAISLFHLII